MRNTIISFISKFNSLTNEDIEVIADNIKVQSVKKGTVLVKEDQICEVCYFVLKGCLRQYVIVEGIEKTTQFYTEEQAAVLFSSYLNQMESESYLSCIEDSILIVGEIGLETKMYNEFPKLEQITRMMMEQNLGKSQDEFNRFVTNSPEERYLYLLKTRPELFQRVPQHQLASYIGVTPESLSRIRKRVLKKN
jgi:CRP-like cAMP-binding protein